MTALLLYDDDGCVTVVNEPFTIINDLVAHKMHLHTATLAAVGEIVLSYPRTQQNLNSLCKWVEANGARHEPGATEGWKV